MIHECEDPPRCPKILRKGQLAHTKIRILLTGGVLGPFMAPAILRSHKSLAAEMAGVRLFARVGPLV